MAMRSFILFFLGGVTMGATELKTIEVSVWYRERIMLPPGAEVNVILEDVAKMDVKAERIATKRLMPEGGPPWDFSLHYDSTKIKDRGHYALRARVEVEGRLMFTSTEHIPALDHEPGTPVDIRVSMVPGEKMKETGTETVPDASLANEVEPGSTLVFPARDVQNVRSCDHRFVLHRL
jgi:putative lipoprotein